MPAHLSRHAKACLFLLGLAAAGLASAATAPETQIQNRAVLSFRTVDGALARFESNDTAVASTIVNTVVGEIELLRYAPNLPDQAPVAMGVSQCLLAGGSQQPLPASLDIPGHGSVLIAGQDLAVAHADTMYAAEPVFVRVADSDHNLDPAAIDTATVVLQVAETNDLERIRLSETGPDTGVFTGYLPTSLDASARQDCVLSVARQSVIQTVYEDFELVEVATRVLIDPFGVVFDSTTGQPVDGVTVTVLDALTGLPATVFGDDGQAIYPSTVVSGGTVTDSLGRVYDFPPGFYRFPFMPAGTYRLVVTPPPGHAFPSAVADAALQDLPGAPWALPTGSRGEQFVLFNDSPPLHLDIPVDPPSANQGLVVTATLSSPQAEIGDFLQLSVTVSNPSSVAAVGSVDLATLLPAGFSYAGARVRERTGVGFVDAALVFGAQAGEGHVDLGILAPGASRTFLFPIEVGAGARTGQQSLGVQATGDAGAQSVPVRLMVVVRDGLMRDQTTVVGEVLVGACGAAEPKGMPGVRVLLEDGTYAVTDERGRYNFRGLKPGTHVVQLDLASLPEDHEVVACAPNTRHAGRSYSQFVDLARGMLWRADFRLQPVARPHGRLSIEGQGRFDATSRTAQLHYTLTGSGVALRRLRATFMLPTNLAVQGVTVDGQAQAYSVQEGVLILALGDPGVDWTREVQLRVQRLAPNGGQPVRALVTVDGPTADGLRLPVLELAVPGNGNLTEAPMRELSIAPAPAADPTVAAPRTRVGTISDNYAPYARTVDGALFAELAPLGDKPTILWPPEGTVPAVPAMRVAVLHATGQQVDLWVGDQLIERRAIVGVYSGSGGRLITEYIGVPLVEGPNALRATVRDAEGNIAATLAREVHYSGTPVRAELIEEMSRLVADGRNPVQVAVRLFDRWGQPVHGGYTGKFDIGAPYAALADERELRERALFAVGDREPTFVVGDDGIALIELAPTTTSGEALLRFPFERDRARTQELRAWIAAAPREWVLVGLAEGTVGHAAVQDNMQAYTAAGGEPDYSEDGRIAFYAKGQIKGEYLLTLAYDTAGGDAVGGAAFDQTIDPNRYYTLYGDASEQRHDAASTRKLYLKLERRQFYALFGDYDTGLTVTELSRYQRKFNGLKSEYRGARFGYTAFASEATQAFVRDELQGDGTSGLYRLSRRPLLVNSEKVVIEVRDRFHSETVLTRRELTRFLDYSIDYVSGTLWFKEPVASRDALFNPQFIVATYEIQSAGEERLNAGGRAAVKLGAAELGVTALHEGAQGYEGELRGADLKVPLGATSEFRAEVAESTSVRPGQAEVEGTAYLAEVRHQGETVNGRVYLRDQAAGFGIGQQQAGEADTRKYGIEGGVVISQGVALKGAAFVEEASGNTRTVTEAALEFRPEQSRYSATAGLRRAEDEVVGQGPALSEQVTLGGSMLLTERLSLTARAEVGLRSTGASADYPDRYTTGAEYRLTDQAKAFVQHEIAAGALQDSQMTRIGVTAQPWTQARIDASVSEALSDEAGGRTFANLGLTQGWQVSEALLLDFGVDRTQTLRAPGNLPVNPGVPPASGSTNAQGDFTALHAGATWRQGPLTIATRIEGLDGDLEQRRSFTFGALHQRSAALELSAALNWLDSAYLAGGETSTLTTRFGLAWRPTEADWILFDRLDLVSDESVAATGALRSRKLINNLNANWQASDRFQLSIQNGLKLTRAEAAGLDLDGTTLLLGFEGRYDFAPGWDLGVQGAGLRSNGPGTTERSYGLSIGRDLATNVWVSLGYNLAGFHDPDFVAARYTVAGPYLKLRIKFDQDSLRELLDFGPAQ